MDITNIAEILNDKPNGTKLYTPISGDVWLVKAERDEFTDTYPITVSREKDNGVMALNTLAFTAQGKYMNTGECLLFPSKKMRDWEKLTWRRGDVLIDNYGISCMFNGWTTDDYTQFHSEYSITLDPSNEQTFYKDKIFNTEDFCKAGAKAQKNFIANHEKEYKGKFNPETFEIEKPNSEFKDGDVVYIETEDEYNFKPFDKVLVRDDDEEVWRAAFFSYFESTDPNYPYRAIGVSASSWRQCIPYEGNEELVNTSNKPKEGGKE